MKKVKVLHIISSLWSGGVAVLLKNYYSFMDREQVQFDFLVSTPIVGMTEEYFKKQGCTIYHLKGHKKFIKNFFSTIRIVRKNKYKIVHVHHNDVSFLQLFAAMLGGAKIRIAHSHDELFLKGFSKIKRSIYRFLTRLFSNYHFACSYNAGKYLFGEKRLKKSNYMYVHNAIELEKYTFSTKKREEIRQKYHCFNSFVIGNVGRLCSQKNQLFILDIFSIIIKRNPNSFIFFIGKGEDEKVITEKIYSLGLENNVIMIDVCENVEDYLSAFDAFIFPSTHEGLGIALLEAQAADLICYVSDRIPKEAIVTEKVHVISLNEDALSWANHIQEYTKIERCSTVPAALKESFDIKVESEKLQEWYLSHVQQNEKSI